VIAASPRMGELIEMISTPVPADFAGLFKRQEDW
jgi:hypothetical protein